MPRKPLLITGGSGQVGQAIAHVAAARGLEIVAPDRSLMDLTDEQSIISALSNRRWAAVINCAAYTAVDRAEVERDLAEKINAIAPLIMARETAGLGIPMIQVSTDYVFDGLKTSPYLEQDEVNPLGVYGRTKEMGERAVRALNPRHAIVRTAWIVSAHGANFVNTMLRMALERPEISVVDDQIGCPSSADDIAEALVTVATQLGDRAGTWHFVNAGEASWHSFAAHIFAQSKKHGLPSPLLHAIATSDYPTPAKRPANSRLATAAIERDFDIRPKHWQDAVNAILAQRFET